MTHEQLVHIYWAVNPELIVTYSEYNPWQGTILEWSNRHNERAIQIKSIHEKLVVHWVYAHEVKPHLKPLSSLTVEDAKEIIRIINPHYVFESIYMASYESKQLGIPKQNIAIQINFSCDDNGYSTLKWMLELAIDFSFFDVFSDANDTPEIPWPKITDYLRSKGYNLDFEEGSYVSVN